LTAPALLTEADAAEARVRYVAVPDGWHPGAYLLPGLVLMLARNGEGLDVKLSPASARSLATELMRMADAKESS
jgi:hypothetical protein